MATSDTTRLLVLGVVQIFEPANGYQLRQELLSWEVEDWAHVNPGSVYSMLATLAKQGLVERVDLQLTPGARAVAVYRMTPAGQKELVALVHEAIVEVQPFERTAFYAAMSMGMGLLDRDEMLRLLEQRSARLEDGIAMIREKATIAAAPGSPPHVAPLMGYSLSQSESERAWLVGFAESVRRGEMVFRGEAARVDWKPADNDPVWRMLNEQVAYRAKLAELDAKA
ncbi:MAG: PadR family transcriptional regulator [Rhodoglobus sp.]